MPYLGELAGLGAALAWATASLIFSRVPAPATAMNFFKNVASSLVLLVVLMTLAGGGAPVPFDADAWMWLLGSAVVGIVIGDTAYFRSLQILGARRSLMLTLLSPLFAAVLGVIFLDEILAPAAWGAMSVVIAGVIVVINERGTTSESAGHFPGSVTSGVLYGAVGAAAQALGVVWSKEGIAALPGEDTLQATFVRLICSSAVLFAIALPRRQLGGWVMLFFRAGLWRPLLPASLVGTCLGIWLSLVAAKHTEVGIAATLTSLTPVFVLPLVAIFLKQRVTLRAVVGALVAICGVVWLVWGSGSVPSS